MKIKANVFFFSLLRSPSQSDQILKSQSKKQVSINAMTSNEINCNKLRLALVSCSFKLRMTFKF